MSNRVRLPEKDRAENPEITLPFSDDELDSRQRLFGLFQVHAALAFAWFGRDRVAQAGPAAVAEIETAAGQIDPLDRFTAAAFARILGIQAAGAALLALADQCLVTFNFENMAPLQGRAALTFAWGGTNRIAFAFDTAIADVKHVLTGLVGRQGLLGRETGNQQEQTSTD